jgi:hypothetical protein
MSCVSVRFSGVPRPQTTIRLDELRIDAQEELAAAALA